MPLFLGCAERGLEGRILLELGRGSGRGGGSSLVQAGAGSGASPGLGGRLSKETWEGGPEGWVASAGFCVHLVFRFAERHQVPHQSGLGDPGVLVTQSPELPSREFRDAELLGEPAPSREPPPQPGVMGPEDPWAPLSTKPWLCFLWAALSQQLPNQQNGRRDPPPAWPGARKGP